MWSRLMYTYGVHLSLDMRFYVECHGTKAADLMGVFGRARRLSCQYVLLAPYDQASCGHFSSLVLFPLDCSVSPSIPLSTTHQYYRTYT